MTERWREGEWWAFLFLLSLTLFLGSEARTKVRPYIGGRRALPKE
jgi:hypothetical protein